MPIRPLPFKNRDGDGPNKGGLVACAACLHHIVPGPDGTLLHTNGVRKARACIIHGCSCSKPSTA